MKKSQAQKLMLLLTIIMYSCLAKSQDSTSYTLNNIKRYASHMDESFSAMNSNRAGNEQKIRLQAAEKLKAFSDSIDEEMEYLPDDYYFRLSPLISAYRTDIDEYEKLVLNDDFDGKETCLSSAFSSLQQRQASFRRAILSAYENAVSQNPSRGRWLTNPEESTQVVADPQAYNNDSPARGNNEAAGVPAEDAGDNSTTSNNAVLLDTIHTALRQIESAIHSTEQAIPKNDVNTIRLGTTRIANASLTISCLSLLLDAKGKENLYMLAASLRHAAENLRMLAKKNMPSRSEMADSISEMKIKFSSLSTGISFVK